MNTGNDNDKISIMSFFSNNIYRLLGIAIGAVLGVYMRIAILYYKIWKTDTNYCLIYANFLGSFIMGIIVKHKDYLYTNSKYETTKVFYVAITTGLCGSLTSFSGWMIIVNNNLLLQFDTVSSPYGGRFWEFLISLIVGISVPLASLKFGYILSTLLSPYSNDNYIKENDENSQEIEEDSISIYSVIFLIFMFIACLLLVIILPIMIDDRWIYLTYTALLGIAGAYCRYILSFSNIYYPKFPIGTFIANVLGTALATMFFMLKQFYVDYYNVKILAVLFALIQGYCGCLTTVSTLVVELDSLDPIDSYKYTFATHIASQFLLIFIRDIYSYQTIEMGKSIQSINVCERHDVLCGNLLSRINCSQPVIESCKGSDYNSYWGQCSCGKFNSTTIIDKLIIDSQLVKNVSNNVVNVWPVDAFSVNAVTEVFDFCLTYENLCTNLLDRVGCPQHQRSINACGRKGILYDTNICTCGTYTVSSNRIEELITDHALFRRYDLIPYLGYITMPTIKFDLVYIDICHKILEHIQCPQDEKLIVATTTTGDYKSWVGTCSCGKYYNVNSVRIQEVIFHSMTKNVIQQLIVGDPKAKTSYIGVKGLFDLCSSFANVCSYWLNMMECPLALQYNVPCGQQIINGIGITGNLIDFTGICTCGLASFSSSSLEAIINVITMEDISILINIPTPNQPYLTMVSSDPFLQLTQP